MKLTIALFETLLGIPGLQQFSVSAQTSGIVLWGIWVLMFTIKNRLLENIAKRGLCLSNFASRGRFSVGNQRNGNVLVNGMEQ